MSETAPVLILRSTYHRIEKGNTMRDAASSVSRRTHDAEASFRENARRDALRWLSSQLRWERTLDHLRCDEGAQSARAA
jgi:hypothetical protein